MALDHKAFADMIVITVQAALAPVYERLAAFKAHLDEAPGVNETISLLRERVVVAETKAAAPIVMPEPHDLSHVLERLAATEARVARLAAVELTVGELRDKFVTLETKATIPIETHHGPSAADVELEIRRALDPVKSALTVLETRAAVPGPAGKDGAAGRDGKDGIDGISLDDLSIVEQADERTLTIRGTVGTHTKDIGTLKFPWMINRGVYVNGNSYDRGDVVACGGLWHANETTERKPGDGSKAWTLIVRPGRDGRDGKDAEVVPVVSLGGGRR